MKNGMNFGALILIFIISANSIFNLVYEPFQKADFEYYIKFSLFEFLNVDNVLRRHFINSFLLNF